MNELIDNMLRQPLLDVSAPWRQRLRMPRIYDTQIASKNPDRGLVSCNKSGVFQLYAWNTVTGAMTQLTDRPDGTLIGKISPDGRFVYYLNDQSGKEVGHLVRVPFEGGEPVDITSDMLPYQCFDHVQSLSGNLLAFIAADPQGFHFYCIDLKSNGALDTRRLIYSSKNILLDLCLSHDGKTAVMASTERSGKWGQFNMLAINTETGNRIAELDDGPDTSVEPCFFSRCADDYRVVATTDKTGVKRPFVWNAHTGARQSLKLGDLEDDVDVLDWSLDGKEMLLGQYGQAVQHLYIYDLDKDRLRRLDHPNGTFIRIFFGSDRRIITEWQDATHCPQITVLDSGTGKHIQDLLTLGAEPTGSPWKSITFCSSDGQKIQGWLCKPEGDGPFPTILEVHGGPTMVMMEAFHRGCQAWVDHGFAFLSINYRGSTSFGRDFQNKIIGHLGHWELEDMIGAHHWLIEQGIARSNQIIVTGGSYGGYLTLLAMGKAPDLWAGGIAQAAIADWRMKMEDAGEVSRKADIALFGVSPQENPALYDRCSPITYAENVKKPILILQGRNDTRTPARQIETYEEKLKALGKSIEVHWYDAGHLSSFGQTEQAIKLQDIMLRFAYRVLSADAGNWSSR